MRAGDTPLTIPEAAALFMAALTRKGWVFSLDGSGRLHAIIGDPLEGSTIETALEGIDLLQDACRLLLATPQGVH